MTLKRFVTGTAIAVVLTLPAASGFAQSPAMPGTTPSPASEAPRATAPAPSPAASATAPAATAPAKPAAAAPARHMRDGEMRASKLIGAGVYDPADQKIGSVADVIVDRDGKVSDVVIGVGGFLGVGDKHVGVKPGELKRGKDNRLVLAATKDALKQMAAYDLNHDAAAKSGSSTHR